MRTSIRPRDAHVIAVVGIVLALLLAPASVLSQSAPLDSTEVLEQMHDLQEDFERYRESRIPVEMERAGAGYCDERIGRICIWFGGEEEEGFPVVLYSQEDAEFSGAEVKARLELFERENHHLHLRLVGDVVKAELDSGGDLPRIPPLRLGAGLHYHSERWNASGEVRWVDRQSDVATNETPTDGYTFVNASLGYRFIFRQQIIDLLLRGRNLTDQEARSHTSFLKNIAPLPGRDIGLSVKFLF